VTGPTATLKTPVATTSTTGVVVALDKVRGLGTGESALSHKCPRNHPLASRQNPSGREYPCQFCHQTRPQQLYYYGCEHDDCVVGVNHSTTRYAICADCVQRSSMVCLRLDEVWCAPLRKLVGCEGTARQSLLAHAAAKEAEAATTGGAASSPAVPILVEGPRRAMPTSKETEKSPANNTTAAADGKAAQAPAAVASSSSAGPPPSVAALIAKIEANKVVAPTPRTPTSRSASASASMSKTPAPKTPEPGAASALNQKQRDATATVTTVADDEDETGGKPLRYRARPGARVTMSDEQQKRKFRPGTGRAGARSRHDEADDAFA
jgi:hypothetical protein